MAGHKKFNSKSLVIILSAGIFLLIALVAGLLFFEQYRCRHARLEHIFKITSKFADNLQVAGPDLKGPYVHLIFKNMVASDDTAIYATLSEKNGQILAADRPQMQGRNHFDCITVKSLDHPIFEKSVKSNKGPLAKKRFAIYECRVSCPFSGQKTAGNSKQQLIWNAFLDVRLPDGTPGIFSMGFSPENANPDTLKILAYIAGTGLAVFLFSYLFFLLKVRQDLFPTQRLLEKIKQIESINDPEEFKQQIRLLGKGKDGFPEARHADLNLALNQLAQKITRQWEQLEDNSHDLEKQLHKSRSHLKSTRQKLEELAKQKNEIQTRLLNVHKLESVGTLAGGIAHEFNNLFMAITGYASLIGKLSGEGSPSAQKAEKILDLIKKGSESVKQLLGFAKSGKYTPGPININRIIENTLDVFQANRTDINIQTTFDDQILNIFADRSQMESVVMNLLINAAESMGENGQIHIMTRNIILEKRKVGIDKIVSGKFVHISMRDKGKGIETQNLRRVFDPFFTTKPIHQGSGLGLASVYGIVDNHGGFTTVESTLGKGSVFNVFLPAMKDTDDESI